MQNVQHTAFSPTHALLPSGAQQGQTSFHKPHLAQAVALAVASGPKITCVVEEGTQPRFLEGLLSTALPRALEKVEPALHEPSCGLAGQGVLSRIPKWS